MSPAARLASTCSRILWNNSGHVVRPDDQSMVPMIAFRKASIPRPVCRWGLIEAPEPAVGREPVDRGPVDELGSGVVIDLSPDQKLDHRACSGLVGQPQVPGPGLVPLDAAAGGVDQDEGEGGVVQEHLVDQLVLVLAAEVPQKHFPVLACGRRGGGIEHLGRLLPDPHPVSGPALVGAGVRRSMSWEASHDLPMLLSPSSTTFAVV